jgi:hypothetical protein
MCVEEDLKATSALAAFGTDHAATIQACQDKVGKQGAAKVKRCVETALGPAPTAPK